MYQYSLDYTVNKNYVAYTYADKTVYSYSRVGRIETWSQQLSD